MTGRSSGGLYYGWVIVFVMASASGLSMALGALNFGLFIKPMGDDLGFGRTVFGFAQTTRQVASAVTSPLVGALLDRFGARWLLALSAAITGGAVLALGSVNHEWQLIVLFALMGLVGMSGPGALVTTVPVAKWFVRKRGKAMSMMSLGIPVGGVIFIPLTQVLIEAYGWRSAWVILAIIGAGLIIPLALLFARREPEDMGLLPDGDTPGQSEDPAAGDTAIRVIEEAEWTRHDVIRSWAFWRLVTAFSLVMLAMGSVGVHRIPYFEDNGLDERLVSFATALDTVAAGASMFLVGMVIDRFPSRYLGGIGFMFLTVATVFTIAGTNVPMMFLAMITFGFGVGGLMLMQNYIWAEYFGRRHLGSIRGVVMPFTLIIGGVGAPLAGIVHDATGSYTGVWSAGAVLMLLGAALLTLTPPPGKPRSGGDAEHRATLRESESLVSG